MKTKVSLTVDSTTWEELSRLAKMRGKTCSEIANEAIMLYIKGLRRILARELWVLQKKAATLAELIQDLKRDEAKEG